MIFHCREKIPLVLNISCLYFLLFFITKRALLVETWTHLYPDSKVHRANMGPTGPRWAPCRPNELCYLSSAYSITFNNMATDDLILEAKVSAAMDGIDFVFQEYSSFSTQIINVCCKHKNNLCLKFFQEHSKKICGPALLTPCMCGECSRYLCHSPLQISLCPAWHKASV